MKNAETADELLAEASHYESLAIQCGPFDPAYQHLMEQRQYWLNQAIKAEGAKP